MKEAPAFAAKSAWAELKHNVTFTIIPSSENALHARRPSKVKGTFIATF